MTFNTTVECPRCDGDCVETVQIIHGGTEPVLGEINCTLCEGNGWVDANEARDYLAGLEG